MSRLLTTLNETLCEQAARFVLALVLVLGTLVLLVLRLDVPEFLVALDGAAVGFWFGGILRSGT